MAKINLFHCKNGSYCCVIAARTEGSALRQAREIMDAHHVYVNPATPDDVKHVTMFGSHIHNFTADQVKTWLKKNEVKHV